MDKRTEEEFKLWKDFHLFARSHILAGNIEEAIHYKTRALELELNIIDRCGKDVFVRMLKDELEKKGE